MSDDRYLLCVAFDTDEPEFARGVEIGRLWECLHACPDGDVAHQIHITNAEMVLRIGDALSRSVDSTEQDETWMLVVFGPVKVEERE